MIKDGAADDAAPDHDDARMGFHVSLLLLVPFCLNSGVGQAKTRRAAPRYAFVVVAIGRCSVRVAMV